MKKFFAFFICCLALIIVVGTLAEQDASTDADETNSSIAAEEEPTKTGPHVLKKNVTVGGDELHKIRIKSFKPGLDMNTFQYSMKLENVSDEDLGESNMGLGLEVKVLVTKGEEVLGSTVSYITDVKPGRTYTDSAMALEDISSIKGAKYEIEVN